MCSAVGPTTLCSAAFRTAYPVQDTENKGGHCIQDSLPPYRTQKKKRGHCITETGGLQDTLLVGHKRGALYSGQPAYLWADTDPKRGSSKTHCA